MLKKIEETRTPFVSIIIVCYNNASYLHRAFGAIACQTFKDFEVIFVDNGCTDNSVEIAQKFADAHPEIDFKIVAVPVNKGAALGDNKGVSMASGKYLMFHDADDWMDPNTLELVATAALSNNADRVITAYREVLEDGSLVQEQTLGEQPNFWCWGMQHGNLFRRNIYVDNHIQTSVFILDLERTFKFSAFTNKAAYIHEPCYNYLFRFNSISHKDWYEKLLNNDYYKFETFLRACLPSLKMVVDTDNYIYAVYQLTRYYYTYMLHYIRNANLTIKLHIYRDLNSAMRNYLPDYLECSKRALKNKKLLRPYGRRVGLLLYALERLHLMKLALICYHLLAKFVYFKL